MIWFIGAFVVYLLSRPKDNRSVAGVMGGIPNGQGYAQNTSTLVDPGVPFSMSGVGAAPFTFPGNVPVRPTGDPGTNTRTIVAQARAAFGMKILPTYQGRGNF